MLFRKARVVEDEARSGVSLLHLEFNHGIDALGPHRDVPSLDDSPIRDKLDDSSRNLPAEAFEHTAGFRFNFRGILGAAATRELELYANHPAVCF
jgi:hypothetical protein